MTAAKSIDPDYRQFVRVSAHQG